MLGAATLVYALWSVINYIAPRGDSNTSGLPRQDNFDFDHLQPTKKSASGALFWCCLQWWAVMDSNHRPKD